jgi:WD40 repeat protein
VTGFFVRQRTDTLTFHCGTLLSLFFLLLLQHAVGQEADVLIGTSSNLDRSTDVIRISPLAEATESPVITAMDVSPTETLLAAAGDDHSIRLISIADRKEITVLNGHEDWVRSLSFSESGRFLASCADDGWIRVWDVASQKLISEAQAAHSLYAVSFVDDATLLSVGFSSNIYRLNLGVGKLELEHVCDCLDLRTIDISPTKKHIAYSGRDGVLRVREWNGQRSSAWSMAPLHSERVRSLKFSYDGATITTVGEDRRVVHFDVASKSIIGQTEIRGGKLMGLCQLDDERLAVAGADNTIRILGWNPAIPQLKLIGHDGSVSVLRTTNKYLFSTGFDTTIRIWDLKRAFLERDQEGRYSHPVSAQFEDSGLSKSGTLVKTPIQ